MKNSSLVFLLAIVFFVGGDAYGIEPLSRRMLILLDDSPAQTFDIMCSDLLKALLEECTPILVSASLLAKVRSGQPLHGYDNKKKYELYKKLSPRDDLNSSDVALVKSIALSVYAFDQQRAQAWIIKKVNEDLYLLFPKKYLRAWGFDVEAVEGLASSDEITPIEYALGLKVNHLPTVSSLSIQPGKERSSADEYFNDFFSKLFVIYREYKDEKVPLWIFQLIGHGITTTTIVHMGLKTFKEFLSFLNTKIRTKLLLYVSCYASGVTQEMLYKDSRTGVDAIYSYPIIAQGIADVPVTTKFIHMTYNEKNNQLGFYDEYYYSLFFSQASYEVIDYAKLFSHYNLLTAYDAFQIKMPGLEWFSIIQPSLFISIGSILAKSRTQALSIEQFFKQPDPKALLLYARKIPFEIVIDTKNMPALLSMVPGPCEHCFYKITSQHSFDTVIKAFLKIYGVVYRKLFVINELVAGQKIFKNVVIDVQSTGFFLYYTATDGSFYVQNNTLPQGARLLLPYEVTYYKNLLERYNSFLNVSYSMEKNENFIKAFQQESRTIPLNFMLQGLLDMIPNGGFIKIPEIKTVGNWDAILNAIYDMYRYLPLSQRIILWVESVRDTTNREIARNVIVDADAVKGTIVFYSYSEKMQHNVYPARGKSGKFTPSVMWYYRRVDADRYVDLSHEYVHDYTLLYASYVTTGIVPPMLFKVQSQSVVDAGVNPQFIERLSWIVQKGPSYDQVGYYLEQCATDLAILAY